MAFRRFFSLLFALIICGILIPQASHAADLSINSVRIGTHLDKTRMVFDISRPSQFRAFTLNNPARLVVDLPEFQWATGNISGLKNSMARDVRHGILQPGISRIVVDLQSNAAIKAAFTLPKSGDLSDRLVIDFIPAPAGFNPANEKTFGNLSTPPPTFGGDVKSTGQAQTAVNMPPNIPPQQPSIKNAKKPIIVIDPGHGGQDPGAIASNGAKEKDVTLATAKELKSQLEATGRYIVHLTRANDTFIKLQDRVKIARRHNADLFISLHADSIDKPNVSGASIYTLSNTASDAQTAKLAARENQADLIAGVDLSHEDKEVANILIDLAMRDTMNQSKFFANNMVSHIDRKGIRLLERPHRFAGFAVLKAPDIPSVLVEIGFMSNKNEVSKLATPEYRKKIAGAISNGIDTYFTKVQKTAQN